MIVFDTDVITLLTYGQTPKLKERITGLRVENWAG